MGDKIGKAGKCSAEYQAFVDSLQEQLITIHKTPLALPSCSAFDMQDDVLIATSRSPHGSSRTVKIYNDGTVKDTYVKPDFFESYPQVLAPETVTRARETILKHQESTKK